MRWRTAYDDAMTLDWRVCSRARLARDARFDGKFFIGVLTTHIYCRPICRARTSQEKNVCYFPTAAAAAEAGFRPCLRCRPECSPGTPAWAGTKNTVSRALRLISQTGFEDGGVETLAAHLGVGSRHLRRLFLRHLGATPSAVAQTRRLHFTKKLIDETHLPMTQIAMAAGFGCVRRFNAAIRKVYQRTPSQIRALARKKRGQPENQYLFLLSFRAPYDWRRTLAFLAHWATPGVDVVKDGSYRRTISVHGNVGYLEVSCTEDSDGLSVRVQIPEPRALFFVIERIRAMFDLDADWPAIARILRSDPVLGARIKCNPGLRVPGCWNGFEFTVRAMLEAQRDSGKAAALAGRMAKTFGQPVSFGDGLTHVFPTAEILANADLRSLGLPAARAEAMQLLARGVRDGQINFENIVDGDALLKRLAAIPGTSAAAVQYVAMCALREPDAFPSADLRLVRALGLGSSRELERHSLGWRPWRAYATVYLLTSVEEFYSAAGAQEICAGTRAVAGSKRDPWHGTRVAGQSLSVRGVRSG